MEGKMKKKTIVLSLLVLTFAATLLYAAGSGDLIVTNMLGVGTTSPNYAVDVAGDVNVTGSFRVDGVAQFPTLNGALSGLTIANDAAYPNTMIDVTANVIGTVVPSGKISIDCTTSDQAAGNDLDTGTLAASTWYYIWSVYNGTTLGAVASLSKTSPTVPTNFTGGAMRLIGAFITDSSAHFLPMRQFGNQVFYNARHAVTLGNHASYTSLSLAAFVPPNAATVLLAYYSGTITVWFNFDGTTNDFYQGAFDTQFIIPSPAAPTIYYRTNGAPGSFYVLGYTLNL